MPRTSATLNKSAQVKATSAAKASRIEEAGIRSRRKGNLSATTQRAQAERDAKAAAAEAKVALTAEARAAKSARMMTAKRPAVGKASAASRQRGPVLTVQVNTSSRVPGDAAFVARTGETIRNTLGHLAARLTRVEAHFDDVNADKGGTDDKRCTLEARPASMRPVSASATAATPAQALRGAVGKVKRLLTTLFAKEARR